MCPHNVQLDAKVDVGITSRAVEETRDAKCKEKRGLVKTREAKGHLSLEAKEKQV